MRRPIPFVALLFVLLWLGSAVSFLTAQDFIAKQAENRVWAKWPETSELLSDPRGWTQSVNTYIGDHFGLRSSFIRMYNWSILSLFNTSPNDMVLIGRDGWLFWAGQNALPFSRNAIPFTKQEIDRLTDVVRDTQAWMDRHGIAFVTMASPDAITVYNEKSPEWMRPVPGADEADEFISRVNAFMHYPVIDLVPSSRKARDRYPTYHATDSHWNEWGAFTSLDLIMRQLQKGLPDIAWHPDAFAFDPVPTKGLDLARVMGLGDLFSDFKFNAPVERYIRTDVRDVHNFTTICETCQDKTVLMVLDSFGATMIPYLSNTFRKVVYVWDNVMPFDRIVAEKPDIVLFEFVERKLLGLPPYIVPDN